MSTSTTPQPKFAVRNEQLGRLISDGYTMQQLREILAQLVAHRTLKLHRFSTGGASAVTVLDNGKSLEAALGDDLIRMWDRDNAMQCFAELAAATEPELGALGVPIDLWKRGLIASLRHHEMNQDRFVGIVDGKISGYAAAAHDHPPIRYNALSLRNVPGHWSHKQNDAHGALNFLLFWGLNEQRAFWSEQPLNGVAPAYATLLHSMFWVVHVWEDHDFGAWEDVSAEHQSSIAMVAVSLLEQLEYVAKHGTLTYHAFGRDWVVTEHGVRELLDKCKAKLAELGTNECTRGAQRGADLAQLNGLLMQALSKRHVFDDAAVIAICENIENTLMGEYGIRRYAHDRWDGREFRLDLAEGEEAQWFHGSPQLCVIWGDLYQRTGDEKYLRKQVYHFNRMLGGITEDWYTPEAYIVDKLTRQWVADANVPLAWGQSAAILAFASMFNSARKQSELAATAAHATVVAVA